MNQNQKKIKNGNHENHLVEIQVSANKKENPSQTHHNIEIDIDIDNPSKFQKSGTIKPNFMESRPSVVVVDKVNKPKLSLGDYKRRRGL